MKLRAFLSTVLAGTLLYGSLYAQNTASSYDFCRAHLKEIADTFELNSKGIHYREKHLYIAATNAAPKSLWMRATNASGQTNTAQHIPRIPTAEAQGNIQEISIEDMLNHIINDNSDSGTLEIKLYTKPSRGGDEWVTRLTFNSKGEVTGSIPSDSNVEYHVRGCYLDDNPANTLASVYILKDE